MNDDDLRTLLHDAADRHPADPGPSGPATIGGPTVAPSPSGTASGQPGFNPQAMAIYFAGDTPQGTRLYREFHQVLLSSIVAPIAGRVMRALDEPRAGGARSPLDPDYRTLWPDGTRVSEARTTDSGVRPCPATTTRSTSRSDPSG